MKILCILFFIGIVVLSPMVIISCNHEPLGIEKFDTVCFSTEVFPIFQNSCGKVGCHDGSEKGFDARSYESIMQSVTPGNAKKSAAYKAITSVYFDRMPPSPDPLLTKEQRTIIALWINQGAMKTTCGDTPDIPDNTQNDSVCFSQVILPILQTSCAVSGCHDPITKRKGFDLSSYASLMNDDDLVKPYNIDNSELYEVIVTNKLDDRMPPYPRAPLTNLQIDQIKKWIMQGAKNTSCTTTSCDTTGTISFTLQVLPIISNNCIGCHNSVSASGNVNLNGYDNILNMANTIRGGNSILSGAINQNTGFAAMPPFGNKLDACKIRIIDLWVQQGKLNN